MKIHNCEQGSAEWFALRKGVPTSSEFHRIVTPTGKLSTQARKYAFYLIAETLLNRSLETISSLEWVERGKELEPEAARMYEFQHEVTTERVGFITSDDGRIGCSPDRLIVGRSAGLEIKCPAPQTHVCYMLEGFGLDYVPQVQGQLYVGEFEYVTRMSYHPEMPPYMERTNRDEAYIKKLVAALDEFCEIRDKMLEQAKASGFFAERARILTPADAELDA